jgi:aldehyde dehydrogenase (NAD+)
MTEVTDHLLAAYKSVHVGNPLLDINHMGPLIDKDAVKAYQKAIKAIIKQGGEILFGGNQLKGEGYESQCYVEPTIVKIAIDAPIVCEETFAPIVYLLEYQGPVENGIAINNGVSQGLSSSIFSRN